MYFDILNIFVQADFYIRVIESRNTLFIEISKTPLNTSHFLL